MVMPPPPKPQTSQGSVTCPFCGAQNSPGSANCAQCNGDLTSPAPPAAPLPADPASSPIYTPPPTGFSIGIWGPKSSGKSMYLGMLYYDILNNHKPAWDMKAENKEANEFLATVEKARARNHYVEPTQAQEPKHYWFKLSQRDPSNRDHVYTMRILDMPGEWYQDPQKAVINGVNHLKQYLTNCQGLLCLVDPDAQDNEMMMVYLGQLVRDLYVESGNQKLDKRLAFCLTKMDLQRYQPWLQNPAGYIRQKLGENTVKILLDFCLPRQVRFNFACSSVGYFPADKQPPQARSNSGIDWQGRAVIYEAVNIKPFGLLEPLIWLFEGV
jgi:hypothetical protein